MTDTNGSYRLPKWYIWATSVFCTVAAPWAVWVTVTLYEVRAGIDIGNERNSGRAAVLTQRIDDHDRRLARLEAAP